MKKLCIALISDIFTSVPPKHYGGAERIVYMLAEGLVKAGHEVTLFASSDSLVSCKLVPFGYRLNKSMKPGLKNLISLYYNLFKMRREFDVVHCFGRLLYLLPFLLLNMPKIQSYGCPISYKKIIMANRLSRGTLTFTACSKACIKDVKYIGDWKIIYNGILMNKYEYSPVADKDSYLVFLGRINRIKGLHTAISVARAAKKRLIIAGNVDVNIEDGKYFKEEIEPMINGKDVKYIGPVDDYQKSELLGGAQALLFPIEWDEPFGLVMIEALACGTPVIAFDKGAVREIIEDRVTGFVCSNVQQMIEAVKDIGSIDRVKCRQSVERRFSDDVIVKEYNDLYYSVISNAG